MRSEINKRVNEYRCKIAGCDEILERTRFEKNGLRDEIRGEDKEEAREAKCSLVFVRREERTAETKRQCYVQAMHDFDSLLDMV